VSKALISNINIRTLYKERNPVKEDTGDLVSSLGRVRRQDTYRRIPGVNPPTRTICLINLY
jgi:hypothetical protein